MSGVEFSDGPNDANSRPQGPAIHQFRSSNLQLEEEYLQQCWKRCLNDDNIAIPHRIIRIYNQSGDCTRVINTNFLHRDDESDHESNPVQEELGNEIADDAITESLEDDDENEAEVTVLEEVITPESKDFSGECSDDENDEELQTLDTSPSLSAVGNESTINNDQDKRYTDKSSGSQIQNPSADQANRVRNHFPITDLVLTTHKQRELKQSCVKI